MRQIALASLAALTLCLTPGGAQAQAYDPYGPRAAPSGPPPRDRSAVTPFIGMFDGTPRYERHATNSGRNDAAESGLLAINLQDFLPVDAGKDSPLTTGEHGGIPVVFHYLVKYWETYPEAKEREGHVPHLGIVDASVTDNTNSVRPPAGVKAVLDRQAEAMYQAVVAYPFIQRSEGMHVSAIKSYKQDQDPSGEQVWGFQLDVYFTEFIPGLARQRPDGRYVGGHAEGPSIRVCSNCFSYILPPSGRYREHQTMAGGIRTVVDTVASPLWVSRYRGGQGALIPNPELYEAGRGPGEIQILIIEPASSKVGIAARMAPDTARARTIAAAWLTDWRALVNRLNGPSAPRAD